MIRPLAWVSTISTLIGLAAITVFLAMIGIARAHHPLGWLLLAGLVQA